MGRSRSPRHASRFGITSFIYQARRPFHPERFDRDFVDKYFTFQEKGGGAGDLETDEAAIQMQQEDANAKQKLRTRDMGDLLRSKGFLWLANQHELTGMMSQAGSVMTIDFPGKWSVLEAKAWEGTEEDMAALRK